jgi:hypothetical protein
MKTITIIIALLLPVGATAHPNHSCHQHSDTTRHCK